MHLDRHTSACSPTATRCTPSTTAARTWASRCTAGRSATGSSPATGTTRASTSRTGGTFDQFADELRRSRSTLDGDDVLSTSPAATTRSRISASGCATASSGTSRSCSRRRRSRCSRRDPSGVDVVPRRARLRRRAPRRRLVPRPDDADLPDEPRAAARRRRSGRGALPRPRRRRERLGRHGRRASRSTRCRATARAGAAAGWFRRFVEVRDAEGAERALVSAVAVGRVAGRSSPTCCSRPRPTTATSTAATRSTSSTRRSRRSTWPAGTAPRRCSHRCRRSSPAPSGWRRRTPGATRSTSSRCSRTPSPQLPDALASGAAADGHWDGRDALVDELLEGEAQPIVDALLDALRAGATSRRARLGRLVRRRDAASPASRRATSSATGTPRCTRSRSRTPSSRACAARRRPSSCAASSTRR